MDDIFYPGIKFYSSSLVSDLEARFLDIGIKVKFESFSDEDNFPYVNVELLRVSPFTYLYLVPVMKFIDRTKEKFLSLSQDQQDKATIDYICEKVRIQILQKYSVEESIYSLGINTAGYRETFIIDPTYNENFCQKYFYKKYSQMGNTVELPYLDKVFSYLLVVLSKLVLNQRALDLYIPESGLNYLLSIKTASDENFLLFHTAKSSDEIIKSILILLNYGYQHKSEPINLFARDDFQLAYSVTPYQEYLTKNSYYYHSIDLHVYRNSQGKYIYIDKLHQPLSLFDSLYRAVRKAQRIFEFRSDDCHIEHGLFTSFLFSIRDALKSDVYILALSSLLNHFPEEEFEQRFTELVINPHLKSHYQLEQMLEFAKTQRDPYIDNLLSNYNLMTVEFEK